jgi:LPS export ABC transporter protein LptC
MATLVGAALSASLGGLAGACADTATPVRAVKSSLADSADQVMYGAKSVLTDRGLLRGELLADTAFFFDNNTRAELRGVTVTFFGSNGAKNAVLTSREGTYRTGLGQMEARKNVVVVAEDGRRLTTEQLKFNQQLNQVEGDSAFVLTEPGGRRVEGIGFRSDPNMNNVRILKQTRGVGGPVAVPQRQPSAAPSPTRADSAPTPPDSAPPPARP